MTPDDIEAAHARMDRECDDAMARDRSNGPTERGGNGKMNFREIGQAEEKELQRQKLKLRADFTELLTPNIECIKSAPDEIDSAARDFGQGSQRASGRQ